MKHPQGISRVFFFFPKLLADPAWLLLAIRVASGCLSPPLCHVIAKRGFPRKPAAARRSRVLLLFVSGRTRDFLTFLQLGVGFWKCL